MMGGVSELIARLIVSMAAMKLLSYPLACFVDPAAWIAAAVFTGVSYLFVIKKIGRELKEKTTYVPETGDVTHGYLWFLFAGISLTGLLARILGKEHSDRRRKS